MKRSVERRIEATGEGISISASTLEIAAMLIGECTSKPALACARLSFDHWSNASKQLRLPERMGAQWHGPGSQTVQISSSTCETFNEEKEETAFQAVALPFGMPPSASIWSQPNLPLEKFQASFDSREITYVWGSYVELALSFGVAATTGGQRIGGTSRAIGLSIRQSLVCLAIMTLAMLAIDYLIVPEFRTGVSFGIAFLIAYFYARQTIRRWR